MGGLNFLELGIDLGFSSRVSIGVVLESLMKVSKLVERRMILVD